MVTERKDGRERRKELMNKRRTQFDHNVNPPTLPHNKAPSHHHSTFDNPTNCVTWSFATNEVTSLPFIVQLVIEKKLVPSLSRLSDDLGREDPLLPTINGVIADCAPFVFVDSLCTTLLRTRVY